MPPSLPPLAEFSKILQVSVSVLDVSEVSKERQALLQRKEGGGRGVACNMQ